MFENIDYQFVSGNILISQIDNQYFRQMFTSFGLEKNLMPNSENLGELFIKCNSNI